MITKAVGLKLAELVEAPDGNPGSRNLKLVSPDGGEIHINLTVQELNRLAVVLGAGTGCFPHLPHKPTKPANAANALDVRGFTVSSTSRTGKLSV
jgi:hypothetical protein